MLVSVLEFVFFLHGVALGRPGVSYIFYEFATI